MAKREELYDLTADPHGLNNLATDPKPKAKLEAMRTRLTEWEDKTKDQICKLEPMAKYDSDMAEYLMGGFPEDKLIELQGNIDLNKNRAIEGK